MKEQGLVDPFFKALQNKKLDDRLNKWKNHGTQQPNPLIYMVPSVFRNINPASFDPRVVSIGPFHRNDESLQAYEGKKTVYVDCLLGRVADAPNEQTFQECFDTVIGKMEQIKACYAGLEDYTASELANIMVIDACFILELCLKFSVSDSSISRNILLTQYVIYDLILLENQIPFFVLKDIFECTVLKFQPAASLTNLILSVLQFVFPFEGWIRHDNVGSNATVDHILDIFHQSFEPTYVSEPFMSTYTKRSAVDMDRAGVSFKRNLEPNWPLAMQIEYAKFPHISWCWGKPTLKMPLLFLNDFTELVFRNLIVYEQTSGACAYITSYVVAINTLVDTQEDVALLVESVVLENSLGSNEEAANMINRLCKEIVIGASLYDKQLKQLDLYYCSYWPKNIARLRRTYFNSPWNFMALVAAIVLFALTVVQTIYSINGT